MENHLDYNLAQLHNILSTMPFQETSLDGGVDL